MNWTSHAELGRIAVRSLPDWEKGLLDFPASGEELKLMPECRNGMDQLAASCLMMDWLYEPVFHRYGLQKNGMPLPHMLPDADGRDASFSENTASPGKFAEILTGLMKLSLDAWQHKDHREFTRRGGILGHYLQDAVAPTHTIPPSVLRNLFPELIPGHVTRLGTLCYQIADDIEIASPELAGNTLTHAVFYLTQTAFAAVKRAQSLLPALIAAVYSNDATTCRELLRKPAAEAATLTAMAWHTLFCIAEGKAKQDFSQLPLTNIAPLYRHPDSYAGLGPNVFCVNNAVAPLDIIVPGGRRRYEYGFGMTGYSGMKFFLNKAFDRLDFTLGMADIPDSYDKHVNTIFTIETAPDWNDVFSGDMEYGTTSIFRCDIGPKTTAQDFSVDIHDAGTLVFSARTQSYRKNDGQIAFAIPHIAVLNPILRTEKFYQNRTAHRENGFIHS